jgi:restriction system protein
MSIWVTRCGRYGEHESRFLEDSRIYMTWERIDGRDLSNCTTYEEFKDLLREDFPEQSERSIGNWAGQISLFATGMEIGDWVLVPRKSNSTIAVGEVRSGYLYDESAEKPYRHSRRIEWLAQEVSRESFAQDLRFSLGSSLTIFGVARNDAETRIRAMGDGGWNSPSTSEVQVDEEVFDETEPIVDYEELARDEIAALIIERFHGHAMQRLVQSILEAQGYQTYNSPPGPDHGIDILAGQGPLGFGRPRICVQVKSGGASDRPTLDQLIGTMQHVNADHGLLVSWGGFTRNAQRELPSQYFKVRLWGRDELLDAIFEHYDNLDEEIKAEIPLKRIWTIATTDD